MKQLLPGSTTMAPTERYFEDYTPGAVFELGTTSLDEDDLIEFASRYDPQPMHVDREAAARGRFGGLIASGWHTTALVMRQYVDHYLWAPASLASPGVDEIRWLEPVRPGDLLNVRATVLEVTPSTKRHDRGVVRARVEVNNQHGRQVMTAVIMSIVLRRPVQA
jgi:acyl dehydratase